MTDNEDLTLNFTPSVTATDGTVILWAPKKTPEQPWGLLNGEHPEGLALLDAAFKAAQGE